MDEYTSNYVLALMAGVVLTCVGAGISIAGWVNRKTGFGVVGVCTGAVLFLVGLVVAVGILLSSKPGENRRQDREVLSLTARDVRSVVLDREYKNEAVDQKCNLVHKPIRVTDSGDIASVCAALRSAKIVYPNHPTALRYCALTLLTAHGRVEIRVSRTTNYGVILWLHQAFRCDEMWTVLQSIAKKHDYGKLTPEEAKERQRKSDREVEGCAAILLGFLLSGAAFTLLVLPVIPMWRICRRLGFPPSMSLLMLMPVANIVLLCIIGFRRWPIDTYSEKPRESDKANS